MICTPAWFLSQTSLRVLNPDFKPSVLNINLNSSPRTHHCAFQVMAVLSRTSNSLPSLDVEEEEREIVFITRPLCGLPRLFHRLCSFCLCPRQEHGTGEEGRWMNSACLCCRLHLMPLPLKVSKQDSRRHFHLKKQNQLDWLQKLRDKLKVLVLINIP